MDALRPHETGLSPDEEMLPVRTRRVQTVAHQLDITPMIDVTFLLLVFFLVTSTSNADSQARLPKARHGTAVSEKSATVLTVARSGRPVAPVYLGKAKRAENELAADPEPQARQIEQHVRQGLVDGRRDVLIEADRDVAYREVARVAAAAARVPGIELHFAVRDSE